MQAFSRIIVVVVCLLLTSLTPTASSSLEATGSVCLECLGIIPLVDAAPTLSPTSDPSAHPSAQPTVQPTAQPTVEPTFQPTVEPTAEPTTEPTAGPTICVVTGQNCGGTNDFGIDAAVEVCCDPADTCTRSNQKTLAMSIAVNVPRLCS